MWLRKYYMTQKLKTLKQVVTYITLCSTIFWMSGISALALLFPNVAEATDPPQMQFWVNSMNPAGGNIATTTFSGQIYFSGAVNASTVNYSNASPNTATVVLLEGRYDDFRYFDPYSPDKITIADHDVSTFQVSVNGTDPSRLNLSLSSGGLEEATTYTILAKNVCMTGHTFTTPETDWPYCPMFFNTFTTLGGASANFSISGAPQAPDLCNGTFSTFASEYNRPLYTFNAFGNGTLDSIKLYGRSSVGNPGSVIDKVKFYRDKTSSTDSNGNWNLEPGLDPLVASASTWSQVSGDLYSITLTMSPAFTLPTTNSNGSLGFIAIDTKSDAQAGATFSPLFQNDSFNFSGADDAALTSAMQTAVTGFCSSGQLTISSAAQQQTPYIQNMSPVDALTPLQKNVALGIDYWAASGTITSSSIDIIVPTGSGFDPQYGLATLAANSADAGITFYRDNKASGSVGAYDGADTLVALSATPTWIAKTGMSKRAILTFATPLTPPADNAGSNAGPDYFVVIKTSSTPAPGASFQVRIPTNGFSSAFPSSDFTSGTINIQAGGAMTSSNILISEIQVAGGVANDEFVELYNPTSAAVDLSAYSLQYRNATSGAFSKLDFSAGKTIPAYGFFLIAPTEYDGATTEDLANTAFNLDATGGTAFLVSNQTLLVQGTEATIVDKVAWGTGDHLDAEGGMAPAAPAANKSLERKAWYGATDTDMASSGMDEKMGNMEDTCNNFMNFILKNTPVPQNTSSLIENPMANMQGGEGSPVVINEVYYYPATGSTAWIELLNRSASSVTLTSWTLKVSAHTVTSNNVYTFPAFSIPANTYATIWWSQSGTDTLTDLYTSHSNGTTVSSAMSTLAGEIILKDNSAAMKDYVQYGAVDQPTEADAVTAGQWSNDHVVPVVLKGQTMGRKGTLGDDGNRADDWQTYSSPTEGTANSGGDSFAPDVVTGVTLADSDATNFGLTGQDLTIGWTPNATTDPSFEKYLVYILPAATTLNATNHIPIAQIYGGQVTNSFIGHPGITKDSQNPGVTLATGSYRAYVVAQDFSGNRSSAVPSASATLTAEDAGVAGADTFKPFIMHMSVWNAKAGSNIVLLSRFADDRSLAAVPGAGARVVWQAAANSAAVNMVSGTATTTTNCVALEANYHSCTIPSVNAVEGHVVAYYLKSTDAAGNTTFMSASPEVDMASYGSTVAYEYAVSQHPFIIDILAAGTYADVGDGADLGGTVYQANGSALASGYVFIEGSGSGAVQTNASGVFSIADNTMMAGSWPIVIFKDGYMDMYANAFKGDTSLNYYLNSGEMRMGGTGSGYMEMPNVTYTQPGDGMMGVPIENFQMKIGFSKPMKSDTIIDNDISNAGSNIYLTTDGTDRVAGAITYNSANKEATLTVTNGTNLTADRHYTLVITSSVTDDMGNPISGGWRSDGAYESGFNTMMNNDTLWGTGWKDGQVSSGGDSDYYNGMNFDNYGQGGQMMPPYVKGTVPSPGAFGINRNRSIILEFSEPMDSASINTNTIKLYPISNKTSWTTGTAITAIVTLDASTQRIVTLNPSSNLDLNTSNDGWYVLRVMGKVKSAKGIWLGDPSTCGTVNPDTCLANSSTYEASFQLNSSSSGDTAKPSVLGTFPKNNDGITVGTTAIDVGIPAIEIGFSEAMDPDTMTTQNITLKAGSKSISGKVKYDPMSNSAKFVPANALQASTQYTLTIATTTTDLASINLDQDSVTEGYQSHVIYFKTGSADTTSPNVVFANGDDYSLAITYSEPMIAAKQTDTSLWAYSVLNPANYYVNGFTINAGESPGWSAAVTLRAPYNTAGGTRLSTLNGLNFEYDEPTNTVTIKGFNFRQSEPYPTDFQIFVDTVRDKSNNAISDTGNRVASATHGNAARSPLQSSASTFGMLGPGGGGMMMMGPMGGGGPMGPASGGQTGPGMNMGQMGMMKAGAFPMNAMAGQTSLYFIDVPLTKQILSGGKIVLTFPSGFSVSSAQQDLYSPVNKDFNDWNTGTITFACDDANKNCAGSQVTGDDTADTTKGGAINDGITVNSSSRIVNIHINGNTQANDFLHIDLKGILNSSIPKEFGTDGYTVDIKTMASDGALLESITTMPFFINQGGSDNLNVVVNCGNTDQDTGTMAVFLGSPMTGPMEAVSSTFTNGIATSTFSSLPSGQYMIFTDPFITIGANNYLGKTMPEPITVSGATTKNITVEKEGTGAGKAAVTVTLTGDFSTGGTADQVDIFANSPTGFRVKTVIPNTDDATDADGEGTAGNHITQYILYLPTGNWMIGVGPAMPKGPMSGPPKMPDWMPPMSTNFTSDGTNPGAVSISIAGQSVKNITGKVTDGVATQTYPQGTPIADAEVYAYQPNGGFGGANTRTAVDGTFTLKIPVIGTYKVGSFKPGLPNSQDKIIDVRDAGNYDSTGTALTAVSGANPFILKIKKPAYTISGKILNRSQQAVAYTPVWAWQSNGTGHADTMTDSSGNYILYVDNGTWYVEADAPNVGWMQYDLPITINSASQSNINLKPSTDLTWYDITGTVTIDGSAQAYMPIRAVEYSSTGAYLGKEYSGMTDSAGAYTLTVPGTGAADSYKYYRVDIWTPNYGEVGLSTDGVANSPANIKISNANASNANITITAQNLKTVTMVFANKAGYSSREGFINIDRVTFTSGIPTPTGYHKSMRVADLSDANPTVKLEAGDYFFFTDIPGSGHYMPTEASAAFDSTKKCVTVDGTDDTVNFTLPDTTSAEAVITISGTVSGPTAGKKDAWIWVGNPETGFNTGIAAASSTGAYSIIVPILSSGKYMVGAERPGYTSPEAVSNTGTANATIDFTLTASSYSISGKVYRDVNGGTANTYNAGEEIANGFVRAEEITTGAKAHAPVDATGAYTLAVNNGTWKIFGRADGYNEAQYSVSGAPVQITISSASQTGKNIKLTADANWATKTKSKPITPANGGTIDDTAQNTTTGQTDGTGIKMIIPANALGSDSSSGNITAVETAAITQTDSMKPFEDKGKVITATDNSGQAITNLNDYVNLEMVVYKADIASSTDLVDESKLKTMKIGYWDDSKSEWVNLPTTKSAYYKAGGDTEWKMYNGTVTTTGYDEFINDALSSSPTFTDYVDYKFEYEAATNHFTVFALGTSPDGVAPSAPTALTQSTGSGTSVALSWTAPTTNSDATSLTDLYGYAVYRSTDGSSYSQVNASAILAGTTNYTDTGLTAWTSYYYKITAGDDDDQESTYSTALQICSTKTIENGTVAADCTISCNSGYTLNEHTCQATSGGAVITGGGGGSNTTTPTPQETAQKETTSEKTTEEKEITEENKQTEIPKALTENIISGAEKIVQIIAEAKTSILSKISELLDSIGVKRNFDKEQVTAKNLVKPLLNKIKQSSKEAQYAATNFITYGTETTKFLGEGERAGVLHSFQKAYNRLPEKDIDWQDAIKIANGRFPSQQSVEQEKEALKVFGKIYKKMPDFKNSHDEAALKIIAYGIRPTTRNVESEKFAIRAFKNIFGRNPESTEDWDIMRAIAYSGAKR